MLDFGFSDRSCNGHPVVTENICLCCFKKWRLPANNASVVHYCALGRCAIVCRYIGAPSVVLPEVDWVWSFQVLFGGLLTILDVAYNPHAAQALAGSLKPWLSPETWRCFHSGDKDIYGGWKALKDLVDHWLVAGLEVPRGLAAATLPPICRVSAFVKADTLT